MKRIIPMLRLSITALVFLMLCAPKMANAGCVYLKTLEAKTSKDNNVLSWTTMAETDNGFFLIERSNNGIDFDQAGRVQGAGTTIDQKEYKYVDLFEGLLPFVFASDTLEHLPWKKSDSY